jgi:HemY protein
MIRVILFLASVGLIALGFAWFADRPGEVSVVWLGYRIETSIMVAAGAVLLAVVALMVLWSAVMAIVRSPDQVSLFFRHRRAVKGYLAISRGLIAIGAGDAKLARRSADDAARLSPGDPLALLLAAQSAQMTGDRPAAERAFRAMLERDDMKLLGLRGLHVEAHRRNEPVAARAFAEEAAKIAPGAGWAAQAALDHRSASGDWKGALEALDNMKGSLDKAVYRRQRAVLLTAYALELEESDRDSSRALALEAVKLSPDLVPAAALAGRRLAESNEPRKARKILEAAWTAHPHPDLAEAYSHLRLADSARERLARVRKLAEKIPDHIESALALARAALEARDFAVAREVLATYAKTPTRRVAALMAEIEEAEHGDRGRAREWLARATRAAPDPVWTADGIVTDKWMPVSPATGRLDSFEWRLPVSEIGIDRPVIEPDPPVAAPVEVAVAAPPRRSPAKPVTKVRTAEPVIPLVHAPDDPGPDLAAETEPTPEPTTPPDRWQKLFQFFR